jgi:hypothetical protein
LFSSLSLSSSLPYSTFSSVLPSSSSSSNTQLNSLPLSQITLASPCPALPYSPSQLTSSSYHLPSLLTPSPTPTPQNTEIKSLIETFKKSNYESLPNKKLLKKDYEDRKIVIRFFFNHVYCKPPETQWPWLIKDLMEILNIPIGNYTDIKNLFKELSRPATD